MENTDHINKQLKMLGDRVSELEKNEVKVNMNYVVRENIFNSVRNSLGQTISLGIGTFTPNLNTIVDISSVNQAFRLPCMTTTQRDAIASPVEGMLIYNLTTHALNHFNGTIWGAV